VGIYQDMSMNQTQLEKMIGKMFNIIKPNEVSDMGFNLEPLDNNEYYMRVTYVVPDDSEYLRSNNMRNSDYVRSLWNREIKNTIKDYFGVDVVISSSNITSKSYYNRQKHY
jgi:hypothetical protein